VTEKLDQLAASLGCPKTGLIEQAITHFVDEQTRRIAAIEEPLTGYHSATSA
jgi:predicted transcriptional regulator